MSTATQDHTLTPAEVEQFHRDGYLGPFDLFTPDEMAELRPRIDDVLASAPPDHTEHQHNRHLESRVVWDLASHPKIIGRMNCIFGPDLLLWRTNFFIKHQGGKEIPWHQDAAYWPIEPAIVSSAWIAIDDSTIENACVQIIPGSHRRILPTVPAGEEMEFHAMADMTDVDTSKMINLEMKAGQFILFNERTLHHSHRNDSPKRRIGLAIRTILPIVRVLRADSPRHKMVILSGEDRMGFNELTDPPG